MFVKVCGLTNLEDSLAAIDAGAQAIGFNFVPTSPRFLTPEALSIWISQLPSHIWKVGIFANQHPLEVELTCNYLGLDVAQLHGQESRTQIPLNLRVWKAVRVTPHFDPAPLAHFPTEALLLDGPASGIPFDWATAPAVPQKLILAGGLDHTNVAAAIERLRPWGVDVCSRIESSPGKKDHILMRRFIQTVLSC